VLAAGSAEWAGTRWTWRFRTGGLAPIVLDKICPTLSVIMNKAKARILIVDNEPALTNVLKATLEESGDFEVREENNPSFTVATARQFRPDLIVLDIKMPDMDGADVAIRLKAETELAETPVVFLTGTVTAPEIVRHGRSAGGLRFLPKTMRLDDLVKCLKDILSGSMGVSAGGSGVRAA
jgi:two-component system, OmpR family, response regulator